ncbi:MAG: FAD-dependent monooxygenase [Phycisphaerales bacterium]
MRTTIIGAGIGGLTTAIALRRAGLEVQVFERAPEPREVGAGIGLWGNAVGALRRIDLADRVLARGESMQTAEFRLASGKRLSTMHAAEFRSRGLEPIALVHRAELLDELLKAAGPGVVHFGRALAGYDESPSGVTARFETGDTIQSDLLIGADGLKSRVRAQLLADGEPRYSGYTCWRGVVQFPDPIVPPGYVAEVWGRGARFGITRIGAGRVYWWATINAPASPLEQGQLDDTAKGILFQSHGAFCEPVPALIRATDAAAIVRNDIYDRAPTRTWTRGRVLLIGDAAHPTTPNLGQGGCMAIEDGVVLAPYLRGVDPSEPGALESRLAQFVRRRYPKTAQVVRQSRFFGAIGQWTSPLMCWGRNLVMSLVAERSFRWSVRKIGTFED